MNQPELKKTYKSKMTTKIKETESQIAVLVEKSTNIELKVNKIEDKLERSYVTREEFDPIKKIVYGMVITIFIAVLGALIKLVIIK